MGYDTVVICCQHLTCSRQPPKLKRKVYLWMITAFSTQYKKNCKTFYFKLFRSFNSMKRVSILIDYLLYFCLTFDIRRCVLIKILISYFSAEEILTLRPFQKKNWAIYFIKTVPADNRKQSGHWPPFLSFFPDFLYWDCSHCCQLLLRYWLISIIHNPSWKTRMCSVKYNVVSVFFNDLYKTKGRFGRTKPFQLIKTLLQGQ